MARHHPVEVYTKLAQLCEAEGRTADAYEHMKKAVGMQRTLASASAR